MITLIDVVNVQPRGWKARERISRGWPVVVAQESNEKVDPVHGLLDTRELGVVCGTYRRRSGIDDGNSVV